MLSLALGAMALPAAFAQALSGASEEAQVKAYVDMLRKDIHKDYQSIVDEAMSIEPGQKTKFRAPTTATRKR